MLKKEKILLIIYLCAIAANLIAFIFTGEALRIVPLCCVVTALSVLLVRIKKMNSKNK